MDLFFFKGSKNTSAYISAPCCSFLQDICFWPLSEMMCWAKWTSSLTHSSFSSVLTKIPAADTALKNNPKNDLILDQSFTFTVPAWTQFAAKH